MAPEVNHTGSFGGHEGEDGKNLDDIANIAYNDLAERIDRFLTADAEKGSIREGTQNKAQEALRVIGKALKDYGYIL